MKRISTFFVFCLLMATTSINAQNFEWAKSFGNITSDYGYSTTTDASGNVYVTGLFKGTVDFNPPSGFDTLASVGPGDVFVLKMDSSGNFLWAKSFGGITGESGRAIKLDAFGNIFITGNFSGTVDFDPGAATYNLTAVGQADVFVLKLDSSGNFIWARSFGSTNSDYGQSIITDANGDVYTIGKFTGSMDSDPGPGVTTLSLVGYFDFFIQKMDSSGNFLWARSFGSINYDDGTSISIDGSGNIYATGFFDDSTDFDPGPGVEILAPVSSNAVFILKMDSDGNYLWAKSIGAMITEGYAICVDAFENVYTTGYFEGTGDFDPGAGVATLSSAVSHDVFIQKLDSAGNLLWAKSFGGTSDDDGYSISTDSFGNVYTAGFFQGTADFDPGAGIVTLASAGDKDVFVQKMDPSGNFLWAKSFGGTGYDRVESIHVDAFGNIYTTGYFQTTVDFDPGTGTNNLTSAGEWDIFVHKMSPAPSTAEVTENTFGDKFMVYPNPTDGNFSIDLGNVYQNTTISIFDVNGKLIETKSFSQTQIADMSMAAPAGVYLLKVNSGDKKAAITLVKE
ncbi:hypothetical protein SDC9_51356 [bioreactor metagenome]|uniref:Secretion system C-terminal sorting domain-containing protein n=1 Tax=bioreactor metagenome TaxID=1076179 RepID=A0A644WMM5_9ZZZZ